MPSKTRLTDQTLPCYCGSKNRLGICCLPLIKGTRNPVTAEELMRSRYTAHAVLAIDYLWDTWSPEQRMRSTKADIRAWAESCDWLGLNVLATTEGGSNDDRGEVEFIALYRQRGQLHQHHEISEFRKVLGKWFYVDHVT